MWVRFPLGADLSIKDRNNYMATEKHWASRQEAKQDEVRNFVGRGLDLALARRKEVGLVLGAAALIGAAIGFFVYARAAKENEAWDKLSLAEAYTYYNQPKQAAEALAAVAEQRASPAAAGLAGLIQGDLKRSQGDNDGGLASLARAAEVSPEPLKPFALAQKVSALEASGKPADCVAAAQSFLDANAEHFLAPQVYEAMARSTWQKISLQFTDTPWAARANARLQQPTK
jgi:hypothetical protein